MSALQRSALSTGGLESPLAVWARALAATLMKRVDIAARDFEDFECFTPGMLKLPADPAKVSRSRHEGCMLTRCPFCAEQIQEGALKCKHCGEWITLKEAAVASADISLTPSLNTPQTASMGRRATGHLPATLILGTAALLVYLPAIVTQDIQRLLPPSLVLAAWAVLLSRLCSRDTAASTENQGSLALFAATVLIHRILFFQFVYDAFLFLNAVAAAILVWYAFQIKPTLLRSLQLRWWNAAIGIHLILLLWILLPHYSTDSKAWDMLVADVGLIVITAPLFVYMIGRTPTTLSRRGNSKRLRIAEATSSVVLALAIAATLMIDQYAVRGLTQDFLFLLFLLSVSAVLLASAFTLMLRHDFQPRARAAHYTLSVMGLVMTLFFTDLIGSGLLSDAQGNTLFYAFYVGSVVILFLGLATWLKGFRRGRKRVV